MKKVIFILFFICLFSCQEKKLNPYIGNWYFDQIVDYDSTKIKFPKIILETRIRNQNEELLNSIINLKHRVLRQVVVVIIIQYLKIYHLKIH